LIAEAPDRPGTRDLANIEDGLRAFPVWLAARRRRASRHVIFYVCRGDEVFVVRILHDAMDAARHLRTPADNSGAPE
jgi:plasmid stabilization system protein ParE